ncbi:MAG: HEAT repeat domain-containing protein [Candidatus Aenigmarchaeota archaeon]|nr:HEAT repeat domain-containing protein [Candidatus Aenigmarchaeota archaeon]
MCRFSDRLIFGNMVPDPRFALPGATPQYAPHRDFKTEHIKLEFSFDIAKKTVFGKSATTVKMLVDAHKLVFDVVNMKINSVKDRAGRDYRYDYDDAKIIIYLDRTATAGEIFDIMIDYKIIKPKLGVYFIEPDRPYPKKPVQIYTHSEAEEARYWFPCHDSPHEKCTTEMLITVASDFFALSNGALVNVLEDRKGGKKTYHWKMRHPHSSYLVMFAVGRFIEIKEEWDGIPITYYCEKGREADTRRAFGKTPKIMEFFSKKIGVRYPYEKYAQVAVADFIFGGMEHTTATTQTDLILHDERAHEETWHDNLVAHELAHQWFGDLLTCRDWAHAWLNESFAWYFDALFVEHDKGEEEFLYHMYEDAKVYFAEDKDRYRRPIVTNIFFEPSDIFDRHLYEKGSLVLNMLRHILGTAMWWKCINHYVEKNKNKTVETENLIEAIEEVSGRNMKRFFDQWIYGAGHPELQAQYYWDDKTKEAVIRIAQVQKTDDQTPLFALPLTIEIITKEGRKKFTEILEEKQKQFRYKINSIPFDVRIDPDNAILKKMDFIKPKSMWLYQLENDSNILGRIAAAQEIAKLGNREAVEALAKHFERERSWGVQAETALALGTIKTDAALKALQKMMGVKHPKARRAVAAALGEFKTDRVMDALKTLVSDKNSYFVPAEAVKSIGKTNHDSSLQLLKRYLPLESWNDVIKAGVLEGIAQLQTDESIQLLKAHAKYGYHYRSRMAAIRNLGLIGKGRKDVLDLLIEFTKEDFALVQLVSVIALGDLGDERAIPLLEDMTKGHRDGRVKRQAHEAIRKIYTWLDTDLETAEIKERYEKLKKDFEAQKKRAS